jgi:hypothetical protein
MVGKWLNEFVIVALSLVGPVLLLSALTDKMSGVAITHLLLSAGVMTALSVTLSGIIISREALGAFAIAIAVPPLMFQVGGTGYSRTYYLLGLIYIPAVVFHGIKQIAAGVPPPLADLTLMSLQLLVLLGFAGRTYRFLIARTLT